MAARNTVQKTIIHDALVSLANHPTADEVYEAVHATHPSISRATVFRTLSKLSDEGVVLRVRINNGADHFDHQTFPHYHVHCVECGRVDDVIMPAVDDPALLDERASAVSGYAVCGHELQFDGLCPACQKAREEVPSQVSEA